MAPPRERVLGGALLPPGLAELEAPPARMYLRGELPRGPRVAIVGTRHPSRDGALYAFELAARLAHRGVSILSGGAEGIDSMAHRGALAVGGSTVVVAPGGFDRPFPPENGALFREIVERGGAYLSLAPSGRPATRAAFFPRNACLVALCHALVVVEAPVRSGARNAAAHARRLGRPLFVVPTAPYNRPGIGCILELKLGGRPLFSERDVLELLSAQRLHAIPISAAEPDPGFIARSARGALVDGRGPRRPGCVARAPACVPARAAAAACAPARKPDNPRSSSGRRAGRRRRRLAERRAAGLHTGQQMLGLSMDSAYDADALRVVEAVRAGAMHADEVSVRTGLPVARIQELLLTLALRGVLVPDLTGRLKVVTS